MMSFRYYRRSRRGFTLLEVLVALTILSLGVVTLLQIFSLGLRLGARSAVRTESAAEGARVMDELLARKKLPEGGETGTLGGTGRWQAQVQTVNEPSSSLSLSKNWELKEVTVELYTLNGRRERLVDLKTFRLGKKGNP
jgi:prepilin-type N-terminal cleavage/methylation domain-containing protein